MDNFGSWMNQFLKGGQQSGVDRGAGKPTGWAGPPSVSGGGQMDPYSTWYNSLAPSTQLYAPAPGSANLDWRNQQQAQSDAQFGAAGISDPWTFALSGLGTDTRGGGLAREAGKPGAGGTSSGWGERGAPKPVGTDTNWGAPKPTGGGLGGSWNRPLPADFDYTGGMPHNQQNFQDKSGGWGGYGSSPDIGQFMAMLQSMFGGGGQFR